MSKFFINKDKYSQGLTLVEVLVAVLILSIVLVSTFTVFIGNVITATSLQNNVLARGLTQEGLEITRNLRDTISHATSGTQFGLPASIDPPILASDGGYKVQWDTYILQPLAGNPFLKFDESTGLYNYDTGIDTIFRRRVDLFQVSSDDIRITVTVSWDERGETKSIVAETHYFSWQ